ncbi:hypothetical protein [Amycolatopsis lexingtonensis]|uniref:hypothetical protein n=1 Tax=Amycolatopsis lexingtonensis TaxID=218822 RepID=UPI003F6E6BC5
MAGSRAGTQRCFPPRTADLFHSPGECGGVLGQSRRRTPESEEVPEAVPATRRQNLVEELVAEAAEIQREGDRVRVAVVDSSGSTLELIARDDVAGKYAGVLSASRMACTTTSRAWVHSSRAPNQNATCSGMVGIGLIRTASGVSRTTTAGHVPARAVRPMR